MISKFSNDRARPRANPSSSDDDGDIRISWRDLPHIAITVAILFATRFNDKKKRGRSLGVTKEMAEPMPID